MSYYLCIVYWDVEVVIHTDQQLWVTNEFGTLIPT